ncbi:hypothetical protein Tco_0143680 [Tanacetum coccineum]
MVCMTDILSHSHALNIVLSLPDDRDLHCSDCGWRMIISNLLLVFQDEGQAGPNPGDVAESQPPPSHVVLAGPDLEHMNLEASGTSIQPNYEQMDDEFTTTAYPNVQENLKLLTEGEVRLEDPASSPGTLSSLQNLDKELSFTNQFLAEKSQEDEPEKTNI